MKTTRSSRSSRQTEPSVCPGVWRTSRSMSPKRMCEPSASSSAGQAGRDGERRRWRRRAAPRPWRSARWTASVAPVATTTSALSPMWSQWRWVLTTKRSAQPSSAELLGHPAHRRRGRVDGDGLPRAIVGQDPDVRGHRPGGQLQHLHARSIARRQASTGRVAAVRPPMATMRGSIWRARREEVADGRGPGLPLHLVRPLLRRDRERGRHARPHRPLVRQSHARPAGATSVERCDVLLVTHGHHDHLGAMPGEIEQADALDHRAPHASGLAGHPRAQRSGWTSLDLGAEVIGMNKGGTRRGARSAASRWSTPTTRRATGSALGDVPIYLGEAAGFVVELENGPRIYHAGRHGRLRRHAPHRRAAPARRRLPAHRRPLHDGPAGAARAVELLGATHGRAHPLRHVPRADGHAGPAARASSTHIGLGDVRVLDRAAAAGNACRAWRRLTARRRLHALTRAAGPLTGRRLSWPP